MKNFLLPLVSIISLSSVGVPPPSRTVWAAISVSHPIFIAGKGDIDIQFGVVNDTAQPIRYRDILDTTSLLVNGVVLPDSSFRISEGPGPIGPTLAPGETFRFGKQLTSHFKA